MRLSPSPASIALAQLLGERVLALREQRGLEQAELAALAGVEASSLSRLETGQATRPPFELILRLAVALGEPSIDRLLGESLMSFVASRLPAPPRAPRLRAEV